MGYSNDDVAIRFGANIDDFVAGAGELKEQLQTLKELAIEAFAVEAIDQFIDHFAELGTEVARVSAEFGLSVEQVQEWRFVMEASGASADSLNSIFLRLQRAMDGALKGNQTQADAFERLGVSAQFLRDHYGDLEASLLQLADGYQKLGPASDRNSQSMLLMGRGVSAILPALAGGRDGLLQMMDAARETGGVFDSQTIHSFTEIHHSLVDLKFAAAGAAGTLVSEFSPAIQGVAEDFAFALEDITKMLHVFEELRVVASVDLVIAFGKLLNSIQDLGAEAGFAADLVVIRWREVGAIITAVATGSFSLVKDIEAEADAQVHAAAVKATSAIRDQDAAYVHLKDSAIAAGNAQLSAEKAAEAAAKIGTPPAGKAQEEDHTLELNDIATQQAIAKANLATKIAMLQAATAAHQITKQQEVAQEKVAAQEEYMIDVDVLTKKADLYDKDSDEYSKALNQMLVLQAQHDAKMAQLDVKMAQANAQSAHQTQKAWMDALQPVEGAMDGMLRGVLQGTETVGQALSSAFENAAISVVESIAKMLLEWLAFEAATAISGEPATWSDFMALNGKGGSGGGGLGSILGFETGTDYVPSTGLYNLHEGEIVVPPDQSAAIRSGASFGGGGQGGSQAINVTFQIQAIDTQTGASFIQNNAASIASVVAGAIRNNNSSLNRALKGTS